MNAKTANGSPPIDMAVDDWKEVLRILEKQVPGIKVWAFGSRARRTAKPYSDLDLALITEKPMTLTQLVSGADGYYQIIEQSRMRGQTTNQPS